MEEFETPEWVKDAVFYQIFPERFANGDRSNDPPGTEPWGGIPRGDNFFGGDLQGVIDRADYLEELGVTAIWFNPLFVSVSNHKYDTSNYRQIDPHFGTVETFRRMVDTLHARGIRVVLDGVFNHTGDEFWAFQDIVKRGTTSPYWDWYFVHGYPIERDPPNYEAWWGLPDLPKLNTANPGVRAHLFDAVRYWMRNGADGWRLDVPNEVPHDFWRQFRTLVKGERSDAYIVGEIWEDGSPWLGGDQFDAVMNYTWRDAVLDFFAYRSEPPSRFDRRLAELRERHPRAVNEVMWNLLGSHDTERFLTAAKHDVGRLRLAVLFQMTYIGAPIVYYGDEVGMQGGPDPNCRGTFPWNPDGQDRELLDWYKQLIGIRRRWTALRRGSFETVLVDDDRSLYGFLREWRDEHVIVLVNNGAGGDGDGGARASVRLPGETIHPWAPLGSVLRDALTGTTYTVNGWGVGLELPAGSGAILVPETAPRA